MALRRSPQQNVLSRQSRKLLTELELDCYVTELELDCNVWRNLPSEILEKDVISKLPFSSLVKYRVVSKGWCSTVIPSAARHIRASDRAGAFLYFRDESEDDKGAESEEDSGDESEEDFGDEYPEWLGDEWKEDMEGDSGDDSEEVSGDESEEDRGDESEKDMGRMWWSRVFCDKKSMRERFPPNVIPKDMKNCRLVACEGGLLFFVMWRWERKESMMENVSLISHFTGRSLGTVRNVVVSNPLTGKSKLLSLPAKLLYISENSIAGFACFGIVVDSRTGNYEMVVGGMDTSGQCRTFLYNSLLSEWVDGPSMAAALPDLKGRPADVTFGPRSTFCNGSLYWKIDPSFPPNKQRVIKFDLQSKIWSSVEVDAVRNCRMTSDFQIAAHENAVLMWHVHRHPLYKNHVEFRGRADENTDDADALPDLGYPLCEVGSIQALVRKDLTLKVMPQDMIDGMEGFVQKCDELGEACHDFSQVCEEYFAFSQGGFVYHIMRVSTNSVHPPVFVEPELDEGFLRIVVQNVQENSYTELPIMKEKMFSYDLIHLCNVWSFCPSLISVP